jgi:hypothetical protein
VDGKGTVYVGGSFLWVWGSARNGLAAIDASGKVTSWNPNPDGYGVSAIVVSGNGVYVGGTFTQIAGQPRNRLAFIDSSGQASSFHPIFTQNGTGDGWVDRLGLQGDQLLANGIVFDPDPRTSLVAYDSAGNRTAWNPAPDNEATAFATLGSRLFVAGSFTQIGGQPRSGLAAFDSTGALVAWNATLGASVGLSSAVETLAVFGGRLFAGGVFTTVASDPGASIAWFCP